MGEYNRPSHTSFPSPAPASEEVPLLSEASYATPSSIQNTNSAFVYGSTANSFAEGLSQTSGGGSQFSKKSVAETQG